MEEAQVSNAEDLNSAPESFISEESSDFFADLEQSVNGGIIDNADANETSQNAPQPSNIEEEQIVSEAQTEDVETLKKRYSDSSAEGKRLNQRLQELEPYMPVLDEMRKDPKLVTHVKDYFEGGGQAPESMVDKMKLGEDFIFDPDEAVSDPNSDSARVLTATIDGVVQRRLTNELTKQKQEFNLEKQVGDFKTKHNMNDSEWSEFKQFADNQKLSLDDIYYLKNRGSRGENITRSSSEKSNNQVRQTQQRPRSLATQGSAKVETSEESQIFDTIMGIDKDLENAFG
jgi:hypothetical protein